MPDVRSRLIPTGKVRWTFMDFPLDQHPNSSAAHLAAGCAFAQNRFWPMFDSLFMNQNQWAEEGNPTRRFLGYASGIGLIVDSFRVCLRERRPWPRIEANKCEGERLGVDGTPTFFVNGRKLPEPVLAYDDIRRIVDSVTALRPAGAVPVATGRR
jgi:protein-disulfide isomerase